VGALVFPFLVWFIQHPPMPIFYASIFASVLVIYRHSANIGRLLSGSENTFSFKGKKA